MYGNHFEDLPIKKNDIPFVFIDNDDCYVIYADLCGIPKEKINVQIKGKVLMIEAERELGTKIGFHSDEIPIGKLCRVTELKTDVKVEDILAEYSNGLLKITIPKLKNMDTVKVEIKGA